MIYLASPYSSKLVGAAKLQQETLRYQEALKFTLYITAQGVPIFSPIAYYHPMAKALKAPTDEEFWHNLNMPFLRRAEAVFVLHLPGWDQSKGVQIESRLAKQLAIPIVHYNTEFQPIEGQGLEIIKEMKNA